MELSNAGGGFGGSSHRADLSPLLFSMAEFGFGPIGQSAEAFSDGGLLFDEIMLLPHVSL